MVNITIERECEHKIIMKQGLVMIVTVSEFIKTLDDFDKSLKYATTNVSIVNNQNGSVLSKIGGIGDTLEAAYKGCIEAFNKNRNDQEENQILLCCKSIPHLEMEDLKDFYLTRQIRFSWINEDKKPCLLTAYVREINKECLLFIYDGADEIFSVKTEKDIIEFILNKVEFKESPTKINNKRKGILFYPTINEFIR